MRRAVLMATIAVAAAGPLVAQEPTDVPSAVRASWTEVSGWVTAAANLVPAERYSYKPVATVRSFGELVGHLADSYNYYCARAAGRRVTWADPVEKGPQDKATLVAALRTALEGCGAAYRTSTSPFLVANDTHTHLHYGNIVTYLRMMGLTPPSS